MALLIDTDLLIDRERVGAGVRYFRDPTLGAPEPHNVVVSTLGEGGVVGLLALGILMAGATWVLWDLRSPLARLAKFAILMRLTAGMFDIYWVGGTGSLPWILAGSALAAAQDRSRELEPSR